MFDALFIFLFLGAFHIIGGTTLGNTLRRIHGGVSLELVYQAIWGFGFGGLPLVIGVLVFQAERSVFLIAEIGVLAIAILVPLFAPAEWLRGFETPRIRLMFVGGILFLVGAGVALLYRQVDLNVALLFGSVFAGAGAVILLNSFIALWKNLP